MTDSINFLVVGVGGQGTILVSDIMAEVGMEAGYDSKKSDILGLAVRGGSVSSHVRWGHPVGSPMCMEGTVDYLVASEPLEAMRSLRFLKPDSTIVMNDYKLQPMLVSTGQAEYPDDAVINERIGAACKRCIAFDATTKALEVGNVKTMNIVLVGVLSTLLDVDIAIWKNVISRYVPAKLMDLNMAAFEAGRAMAK